MVDVSVCMAAYNEEDNILEAVEEMVATMDSFSGSYEIVIIDDGSTDNTPALADQLAHRFAHVRVIHHPTNLGLGGYYRTAFAESRGWATTFFPTDGQFPTDIVPTFFQRLHELDLLCSYITKVNEGPMRQLVTVCERLIYRLLFGPLPRMQGIMMVRTEALRQLTFRSQGRDWTILFELLVLGTRAGWRIDSVPIDYYPRRSGHSKVMNFRTALLNLLGILRLWWILLRP
ncbi:MAG: glycosyltransferase family 2 protein [Vulcanimicrobiota bacterium]